MRDGEIGSESDLALAEKAEIEGHSVQTRYQEGGAAQGALFSILRLLVQTDDEIPEWGTPQRDDFLRTFWKLPGNDLLAGAISTMQKKIKAMSWTVSGPPRLAAKYQDLLSNAEMGGGWGVFVGKVVEDYLTQDRGAFIEIIHETENPASPIVGVAQLDAGKCWPTGDPEKPVIYTDAKGKTHKLDARQVIQFSDMSSPQEGHPGLGFCAISRVLRSASVIRAFGQYKDEKLSSRPVPGLMIAKGITMKQLREALEEADKEEVAKHGRLLYRNIPIVASMSADVEAGLEMVEFRSIPDGFNAAEEITFFIYTLALAFGVDAREFWPATSTGATKADALVQAQKARGKGPGDLISSIERAINWKVLPPRCEFKFDFQDDEEDQVRAEIARLRIDNIRKMWEPSQVTMTGLITDAEARNLMVDEGLLPEEFRVEDVTEEETLQETEKKGGDWWSR